MVFPYIEAERIKRGLGKQEFADFLADRSSLRPQAEQGVDPAVQPTDVKLPE